ncbi:putative T7SS-secreted protein [Streptomyces fradiae]|uniref:putative T7SS-secreted protein n=1 Tax=Streptomyces fradiae TaxID=1906 RepID=UPI0038267814
MGDIFDKLEGAWDGAKRFTGHAIDHATNETGKFLDHIGAEGLADDVEDWGDEVASSLGATVGEQQLGQTEQADELVFGKPGTIAATVRNLRDFESAFDLVGRALKGLDSAHWKGEAADAFRERFGLLPADWLRASDACGEAAKALEGYAKVLTWAQTKAGEAIDLYRKGQDASAKAVKAHNAKVDAYNASLASDRPLPRPADFSDPGTELREQAQEVLKAARSQRNEAADTASAALKNALRHAPDPSAKQRALDTWRDARTAGLVEMTHFGGGLFKGTIGMTNFVRSIVPLDPYNLTHPAEYYKNVNMTLAGLVTTVAHPDEALQRAWEAAKKDPSEAGGRLIPELFGLKGAGGLKSVATAGLKNGAKNGVRHGVDDAAEAARTATRDDPAGPSRQPSAVESGHTDPVDLATGTMYLPQTDLALPGILPLVFRRRVASDYRAGRWFGPSWASTADQRLEIVPEGIVLVCEDGLLLSYPHPAPGVPTLPSHGPRRPLTRDPDGGYTVTDPETGTTWHFTEVHPERALLGQVDDRNGNRITFEYDEDGAPASIVDSAGHHLRLTTRDGRVTALHVAGGASDGTDLEIVRYGYTDGHLTEVVNSSGLPLRFAYDERGRVTSWTDRNGSRYDYVYDEQDRCVAQGGQDGHLAHRFTYDETDPATGHRVTTATTPAGATHRYLVNDAHQVVAEIDPLGAVTRYERDRYNRLLSHTDPLGRTTYLAYDDAGNLTAVTRPDSRRTTAAYNALGLPVRIVHPDGRVVRQTYDERGNRTSVTDPTGATTTFTYDTEGRLTSVTDPLGNTTAITCDASGLPAAVTSPLGATTRYVRDALGRPTAVTDPQGATTRLEWTPEGLLSRRVEPDGTEQSWTYDGEGNCLTHTDALGGVSHFEYTHFDLLKARTGPDGVRHEFTHDTDLRLVEVRNPQGLTWTYDYDQAGRLRSETDFDGRTLTYEHDPAGRLTARTNGLGETIRYERDALGRTVRKDVAGTVTTFAYDVFDELAEAVSPDITLTRFRDRHGRLLSETVNGRELRYTYDALGRRTGRTTPAGAVSAWTYDAAGRRTRLTTSGRTLDFAYDPAGRETARAVAPGRRAPGFSPADGPRPTPVPGHPLHLTHAYDELGRLTHQLTATAGRTLQERTYTYRADGHLTGVDDLLNGPRQFDLDRAGRVTAVHAANWTERYAYDEAGNQTEASWPASHPGQEATGPRAYTGTRITRAGRIRYEHDDQGRVVLRQKTRLSRGPDTWRYTWDPEDRLTSVTTPDGTLWRYVYDPLGRRTAKRRMAADGETVLEETTFTWDGTTLCEQTTDAPDLPHPVALTWDHKGLQPLAQTERLLRRDAPQEAVDDRFFAMVTDLVGTPTELVDESGTLAWHTRTTLWGTTTWSSTSTTYTPLRFPGQYYDPETGLHYNYFRHYDPETARYLTSDPLGLEPAPNPTSYVRNPHVLTDPLGLAVCSGKALDYMADSAIPAGQPVTHGPTATLIGDDGASIRNFQNVLNRGEHDVVAHGTRDGVLDMLNADERAGRFVNGGQIVDAVTNNPNYHGGPLRLLVCHSGADTSGIAQQIANELGVTVRAPTDRVGTDSSLGRGQDPRIDNDGYWRVFIPIIR